MNSVAPRFALGDVLVTPGALALLQQRGVLPLLLLARHQHGDWGDVPADDARANDEAIALGNRVLSAYPVGDARIWVITEADRSVTTVLLPAEY